MVQVNFSCVLWIMGKVLLRNDDILIPFVVALEPNKGFADAIAVCVQQPNMCAGFF